MSFLNAIFLLALPLVAAPILLHLFRRRQRNVIPWGAMEFLTDAVTKGRRWERLEELLLMLLRAAAVLFLVLALARPMVRGYWLGVAPAREVVLVMDDSLSMSRAVESGTVFDEMRERAKEILDDLSEQDAVQLVLAAAGPVWLTPEPVSANGSAIRSLKATLNKLEPTRSGADMFACLQAVVGAEPANRALARRVIVLTDLQAYGWQTDAVAAWQRFHEICQDGQVPTSVEVLDCHQSEAQVHNLAVTGLQAIRTVVAPDESIAVTAEVKNCGEVAADRQTLNWFVGDKSLSTTTVGALAPGASQSIQWSHRPLEASVLEIRCRLEREDDVALDDEEGIVIEVVDEIPILIVPATETMEHSERRSEMRFFTNALGYQGEERQGEWQSVFKPRVISPSELESVALGEFRAVVMLGVPALPESALDRLYEYVSGGGGLWLMLSETVDRAAFNAAWHDEGAGLSPAPIVELINEQGDGEAPQYVHPPDGNHPAMIHLSDTQRLDIDTVQVTRYFQFALGDRSNVSVLLESGNGDPLAVEHYVGSGRIVVQAFPMSYAWSNLPRSKAFVVLVHDWLTYLTQPAATRYNIPAGGGLRWRPPVETTGLAVTLVPPGGEPVELSALDQDGLPVYRSSQTHQPGLYLLKLTEGRNNTHTVPFRVARDGAESDLAPLNDLDRGVLADAGGLKFVREIEEAPTDLPEIPNEKPIWWPLLLALLVLLAGELLLATRTARQRYAAPSLATGV